MNISSVSVPEVYNESADFRFFLKWFELALTRIQYDTTNFFDLYDALRCPEQLLWMLGWTMGYKYDDRLCAAFNRLVILYFMSMIRLKGSKDGVTLAAEINLKQFDINEYGKEKKILYNRLEDTSIPVNSVSVIPHTDRGYIDVVYIATKRPTDACIEYVRPVGMYCFQYAGVRMDANTRVSVDARLTNTNDIGISIGPTHIGRYSRRDYASMQRALAQKVAQKRNRYYGYTVQPVYKIEQDKQGNRKIVDTKFQIIEADGKPIGGTYTSIAKAMEAIANYNEIDRNHKRNPVWYRNIDAEAEPKFNDIPPINDDSELDWSNQINPGYRTLYSLQLCNNAHTVKALLDPIFSLGYGPQDVTTHYSPTYLNEKDEPDWNLRYDRELDESLVDMSLGLVTPEQIAQRGTYKPTYEPNVTVVDDDRTKDIVHPRPAVNPVMAKLGDSISMATDNTKYTKVVDNSGTIKVEDSSKL